MQKYPNKVLARFEMTDFDLTEFDHTAMRFV